MRDYLLNLWTDESRFRVFARSLLMGLGSAGVLYHEQLAAVGVPDWLAIGLFLLAGLARSKGSEKPAP